MKKSVLKSQIPTIIGLIILFLGAGAGVILVGDSVEFLPRAAPEFTPRDITISNIGSDSVTISWVTNEATSGLVSYGQTRTLGNTGIDTRDSLSGETGNYRTHYVNLTSLTPDTEYYFEILSGTTTYNDQGEPYTFRTGPNLGPPSATLNMYGQVTTQAQIPAEGSVVYVRLGPSTTLSSIVRGSGDWSVALASMRTSALDGYVDLSDSDIPFSIDVVGADGSRTTGIVDMGNIQPVPNITLNQPFDFTSGESAAEPVSQALTQDTEEDQVYEEDVIILTNPSFDGETVNTSRPEIQGMAPPNVELSIKVESPVTYQDQIVSGNDGSFSWSPPEDLAPGNHTITISWIEDGVRKFFQRNFVVMAQGESNLPAMTSTPSATPSPPPSPTPVPVVSPTPTPTPTPVVTPTPSPVATEPARVSQPATDSGVPVAGGSFYSFLMLLSGLGLIGSGLLISKYVVVSPKQ